MGRGAGLEPRMIGDARAVKASISDLMRGLRRCAKKCVQKKRAAVLQRG